MSRSSYAPDGDDRQNSVGVGGNMCAPGAAGCGPAAPRPRRLYTSSSAIEAVGGVAPAQDDTSPVIAMSGEHDGDVRSGTLDALSSGVSAASDSFLAEAIRSLSTPGCSCGRCGGSCCCCNDGYACDGGLGNCDDCSGACCSCARRHRTRRNGILSIRRRRNGFLSLRRRRNGVLAAEAGGGGSSDGAGLPPGSSFASPSPCSLDGASGHSRCNCCGCCRGVISDGVDDDENSGGVSDSASLSAPVDSSSVGGGAAGEGDREPTSAANLGSARGFGRCRQHRQQQQQRSRRPGDNNRPHVALRESQGCGRAQQLLQEAYEQQEAEMDYHRRQHQNGVREQGTQELREEDGEELLGDGAWVRELNGVYDARAMLNAAYADVTSSHPKLGSGPHPYESMGSGPCSPRAVSTAVRQVQGASPLTPRLEQQRGIDGSGPSSSSQPHSEAGGVAAVNVQEEAGGVGRAGASNRGSSATGRTSKWIDGSGARTSVPRQLATGQASEEAGPTTAATTVAAVTAAAARAQVAAPMAGRWQGADARPPTHGAAANPHVLVVQASAIPRKLVPPTIQTERLRPSTDRGTCDTAGHPAGGLTPVSSVGAATFRFPVPPRDPATTTVETGMLPCRPPPRRARSLATLPGGQHDSQLLRGQPHRQLPHSHQFPAGPMRALPLLQSQQTAHHNVMRSFSGDYDIRRSASTLIAVGHRLLPAQEAASPPASSPSGRGHSPGLVTVIGSPVALPLATARGWFGSGSKPRRPSLWSNVTSVLSDVEDGTEGEEEDEGEEAEGGKAAAGRRAPSQQGLEDGQRGSINTDGGGGVRSAMNTEVAPAGRISARALSGPGMANGSFTAGTPAFDAASSSPAGAPGVASGPLASPSAPARVGLLGAMPLRSVSNEGIVGCAPLNLPAGAKGASLALEGQRRSGPLQHSSWPVRRGDNAGGRALALPEPHQGAAVGMAAGAGTMATATAAAGAAQPLMPSLSPRAARSPPSPPADAHTDRLSKCVQPLRQLMRPSSGTQPQPPEAHPPPPTLGCCPRPDRAGRQRLADGEPKAAASAAGAAPRRGGLPSFSPSVSLPPISVVGQQQQPSGE